MIMAPTMHRSHALRFLWALWDGLSQTRSRSVRWEDGAIRPTGNPGLRHWLDCAAITVMLLDPVAEQGPAAVWSNSNTFNPAVLGRRAKASYNRTSENKHECCNWRRCDGKEPAGSHRSCRGVAQARGFQSLPAAAPSPASLPPPAHWSTRCPASELCLGWVGWKAKPALS